MLGHSKLTVGLAVALAYFVVKTILTSLGVDIPDIPIGMSQPGEHPFN
jgi:hypothetical protein